MKKGIKRILSGIVLSTMLFTEGVAYADFKGQGDWAVCTREVYGYAGDDDSAQFVGILDLNRSVYRILSGENRDLVNCSGILFFVDKDALESTSVPESNISYQQTNYYGTTTTRVNLRVGPSTESDKIITLEPNVKLNVLAATDDGWLLVDYGSVLGFVYSQYVKEIDFDRLNSQLENMPTVYRVAETTTEVNFRTGPSTDYSVITKIPKGRKLSYIRTMENGWVEVEQNGTIGYLCGDYVKLKYVVGGNFYQVVALDRDINVYNRPYGDVIGQLPQNEACFIYGETDDFYLAETEGRVGYISKKDCTSLHDIFVIIDIGDQMLYLYDGTELILSCGVVTGKDITPTPTGLYQVIELATDKTLKGADYEVVVDYWARVVNGVGIHSMKKREYGNPEVRNEIGSHGCINILTKIMKKIYSILKLGDQVLIKK